MKGIISIITFAVILSFFSACTHTGKPKKIFNTQPVSVKIYDVPPGADPSVSAELGGNGFKGEGWNTSTDYNSYGSKNAVKGGSITLSERDFPPTFRIYGKDNNTGFINYIKTMLYESLLELDPVTNEYIPRLATHWKIFEDKKLFKFRINPNARWSDGKPVLSEDVIATWKLLMDASILDPYANSLMSSFEEPVAESKYIVSFKSKEADWKLFYYLSTYMKILPAEYISKISGKEFIEKYQFTYLPGSGPYLILEKDIIKPQSVTLRRRSDYWGEKEKFSTGLNNFDVVKFEFNADETLEYEKFKKGEIDVLMVYRSSAWNEKYEFDEVKRGLILKRRVFNEYPNGVQGICLNTRKAPFDDIKIRKAFCYAFDRSKYNEKLFYNAYKPMTSYYPGSEYENTANPLTGFNLDSAKMLLSESGWTEKNNDGYLVKNSKVFEVNMPFQKGMDRYLTIYQEDLKKIGIKLNLKESDATTIFKLGNERNFEMLPISWKNTDIPNPESAYKSDIADKPNTTNWNGIKDKRVDELCDKYNITFDQKERVNIIKEIDRILAEFFGYVLMWYAPYQRIVFHNKFGFPDGILGRISDLQYTPVLWFNDPVKEYEYDEAVKDKSKTLPQGETDNKYWINLKRN